MVELADDADRDALKATIDDALGRRRQGALAHRPKGRERRRARRQGRLHRARRRRPTGRIGFGG